MQIAAQSVVSIHYTLTNDQGEVLDSSSGGEPLTYLHGAHNIIPGLENALVGKRQGDQLDVSIAPVDAYGEFRDELVQQVPRSAFQGVDEIEPGMQFHAQGAQGPVLVTVTEVTADTVTVDGNHPLAGERLHFSVEITEVRPATEQELAHGHAHGAHGHDH